MDEQQSETVSTVPTYGMGSLVNHPSFGTGRIIGYTSTGYVIAFKGGESKQVSASFQGLKSVEMAGNESIDRVKQAVAEVLGDYGWMDTQLELSPRWTGGTMELIPGKEGVSGKSIPIEMFFKKIISIREKLRVLEQKINNHPSLSSEEKMELEGYITRSYGSLTSFNVLFADKSGQFKGVREGGGPDGE